MATLKRAKVHIRTPNHNEWRSCEVLLLSDNTLQIRYDNSLSEIYPLGLITYTPTFGIHKYCLQVGESPSWLRLSFQDDDYRKDWYEDLVDCYNKMYCQ